MREEHHVSYSGLETLLTDKDRKEASEVFSRNGLDKNTAAPRQCSLKSPKTFLRRKGMNQLEQHCLAAAEIYESLEISSLFTTTDFGLTLAKSHNFSICSSMDFPLLWTSKYKIVVFPFSFYNCLGLFGFSLHSWEEPESRCEAIGNVTICILMPWFDDPSLPAAITTLTSAHPALPSPACCSAVLPQLFMGQKMSQSK